MLREQKVALGGYSVFTKGKGWRPEVKGSEWEERDDGWRCGGRDKMGRDGKANEEKAKPEERGKSSKEEEVEKEKTKEVKEKEACVKEVKAQEERPPNPYRKGETWWAPITDEEWKGWHGDETYKCKEGGWWTTMTNGVYERYKSMKDEGF